MTGGPRWKSRRARSTALGSLTFDAYGPPRELLEPLLHGRSDEVDVRHAGARVPEWMGSLGVRSYPVGGVRHDGGGHP